MPNSDDLAPKSVSPPMPITVDRAAASVTAAIPASNGGISDDAETHTHVIPQRPTPGPSDPGQNTVGEVPQTFPEASDSRLPQIHGYRIEKEIGHGGMGRVFLAIHLKLGRVEALKLITAESQYELKARERFERETKALASIDHPNVVPVYHAGHWMGFPFLTMKYIPGGSLSRHLERFAGKPELAARLVAKVALAVQALHDAGVIHRDLKPLNILLDENDEPLVADFGLARWLDAPNSDLTFTLVPVGTRAYMAPEQTLGRRENYGVSCDVWSIGITLYELLTGLRPFTDSAEGTSDIYEQIRTAEPRPLSDAIPDGLKAIVWRCLAKAPADRYCSAAAVAADLDRYLGGEPVEAEPVASAMTQRSPRRRRRLGVGLMVLAIAAGAVGAIALQQPDPARRSIVDRLRAGENTGHGLPPRLPRRFSSLDPGAHIPTPWVLARSPRP